MNTSTEKSSFVFTELRVEAYRLKFYIQDRFKDMTSSVKTDPLLACTHAFVAIALIVCVITLPIFATILLFLVLAIVTTLDYLNNTYFYKTSPPWSSSFYSSIFLELKLQKRQPYFSSSEERAELKNEDPELFDFFETIDREILEKKKAYESDLRPVLLFLKAKSDYNDALNLFDKDRAITINGDNNEGVKKLNEKYKIALIDDITHIDEIKNELKKITNPIQHVFILAHGTPTTMALDENYKIDMNNIEELSDILQQKVSKDAHVILYSCSTGQKVSSGENIATKFSKILPGRTIWAPKVPTGEVTLDLGQDFSIKVDFWESKSRWKFLKEKIWNICCLRPFKKIEVECNVTAQIKDGTEYS